MSALRLFLVLVPLCLLSCSGAPARPPNKGPVCPASCKKCDAVLGCMDCKPGVPLCMGDTVLSCSDDGSFGAPVKTCASASGETCKDGNCLTACDVAANTHSYIGCDYWPTTLLNSPLDPLFDFAVTIANPLQVGDVVTSGPANVKVVIGSAPCDASTNLSDSIAYATIPPGEVRKMFLPWIPAVSQNGQNKLEYSVDTTDGAYHLCSTLPVTVYQFNPYQYKKPSAKKCASDPLPTNGECHSYTNDASLLLPTTALQKDYIVAAYGSFGLQQAPSFQNPKPGPGATPGFLAIVATEDGTMVNVTLSANTEGGDNVSPGSPGDVQTYAMMKGEVVEIISARPIWSATKPMDACKRSNMDFSGTYCDPGKEYDLTGTQISASKRIAVFGGHSCAFVPFNKWACDHLEQQIIPLNTWGQQSIAVQTHPSVMGEPNIFRVISGTPMTLITFDPPLMAPTMLGVGEWLELTATDGFQVTGSVATGNARILAVQYMVGEDYVFNQGPDGVGDPAMGLVVPIEQYRKSYDFLTPESYTQSWLTVIGLAGTMFKIDGMDMPIGFNNKIGATGYAFEWVDLSTTPGGHHISSDSPFGINVAGVAPFTSYMFPGGLNLFELAPQ